MFLVAPRSTITHCVPSLAEWQKLLVSPSKQLPDANMVLEMDEEHC
jgi:hypothetical protein